MDWQESLQPAEGKREEGKTSHKPATSSPPGRESRSLVRERGRHDSRNACVRDRLVSLMSGNASAFAFLPCSSPFLPLPFEILTHAPLIRDYCIVASLLDTSIAEVMGTSIRCVPLGHFYCSKVTGEPTMTGGYRVNE